MFYRKRIIKALFRVTLFAVFTFVGVYFYENPSVIKSKLPGFFEIDNPQAYKEAKKDLEKNYAVKVKKEPANTETAHYPESSDSRVLGASVESASSKFKTKTKQENDNKKAVSLNFEGVENEEQEVMEIVLEKDKDGNWQISVPYEKNDKTLNDVVKSEVDNYKVDAKEELERRIKERIETKLNRELGGHNLNVSLSNDYKINTKKRTKDSASAIGIIMKNIKILIDLAKSGELVESFK